MQVDEQFEVDAPRSEVFRLWTSFEHYPEFLTGVDSVYAETSERLRWRVSLGGLPSSFYAIVTEHVPDERLAFVSVDQSTLGWWIDLAEVTPHRTLVTVRVIVSPRGDVPRRTDDKELDELTIRCDLLRFRALAEGTLSQAA
ncbi:SRPBCC family protein [Agrococcus lahaulensis]|uniref:SRPBCC family protein n=1 Tax=Agrococcus lahaulensis TaxID=341722 RepID=UPI00047D1035|nr:SRPBCC family protein [Agrococcus lahaulensis]